MKFGKLEDISQVDFSLPPDPAINDRLPGAQGVATFFIGCTGWSMKEWVGRVYPKGTKSKDFLEAYGRQFNTIELNATHYRLPNPDRINTWKEKTPPDFRFCPKVPQAISHSKDLKGPGTIFEEFIDFLALLAPKAGCSFLQLPPYFDTTRLPLLLHFLSSFPDAFDIAVEFRHPSWFENGGLPERVLEAFLERRRSIVITDVAGRRDVCHMAFTNPTTMVRFVGNGLHPTDYERIDAWVDRMATWLEKGVQSIYFFPHEPDNLLAPDLSIYLLEQVQSKLQVEVRGPSIPPKDAPPGSQMQLF
jgi:uncharacterized protein YecE (DUF72 family)